MQEDSLKKYFWMLINVFIAALIVALVFIIMPAIKKASEAAFPTRTINVSAEGKANIVPDVAYTSLSVVSKGADPAEVMEKNNEVMNKVNEAVKGFGIEAKDIKTSNYNLNPDYQWNEVARQNKIIGYTMTQTLTLKIRDLSKVSQVLAAIGPLGVNQVGDVSFGVDDPDKYLAEAREEAIAKAKEKAKLITEKAGARLGNVVNVSEYQNGGGYPMPYYEKMGMGGDAMVRSSIAPIAPSIEPGSQEISLTVNLTYELR